MEDSILPLVFTHLLALGIGLMGCSLWKSREEEQFRVIVAERTEEARKAHKSAWHWRILAEQMQVRANNALHYAAALEDPDMQPNDPAVAVARMAAELAAEDPYGNAELWAASDPRLASEQGEAEAAK